MFVWYGCLSDIMALSCSPSTRDPKHKECQLKVSLAIRRDPISHTEASKQKQ